MAYTLDSTVGASTANSYVASTSEADAIAANIALLPGLGISVSSWTGVADETKKLALIQAAAELNSLPWKGSTAYGDQALAFPRYGVIPEDGIPDAVKLAQVARACEMLAPAPSAAQLSAGSIKSETVGGMSRTYDGSNKSLVSQVVGSAILRMLKAQGLLHGGYTSIPTPRG